MGGVKAPARPLKPLPPSLGSFRRSGSPRCCKALHDKRLRTAGAAVAIATAKGRSARCPNVLTVRITQIVDLRGVKIIKKNGGWPPRKLDLSLAAPRVKGRKSLGADLKVSGKPVYNRLALLLCDATFLRGAVNRQAALVLRAHKRKSKARKVWTLGALGRAACCHRPV